VDAGQEVEVNGRQEVEVDGGQEVELEVDAGPKVNSRQRRVGDEYAMGGIRLQTLAAASRPEPLPLGLPAASRASRRPQSFVLAAAGALDLLQTLRPPPNPSTAFGPP